MCGPATPSKQMSKQEQEYRSEDDFRTLQRAEEVRGDKARHERAMGHARKQMTQITKVMSGLRGKLGRGAKRSQVRRA